MAKGSELRTISHRTVYGNRPAGEDRKSELFTFIIAPDPFGEVHEDGKEQAARRAYLRAFFYGLRKYMPEREYVAMRECFAAGLQGHKYKFYIRTIERILAHAGQFARVKQVFPWEGAVTFEKSFFAGLRRILEFRMADRIRCKNYRMLHYEEKKEKSREYRAAHRDEINAKQRAKAAANREESRAKMREYRAAHRDEINARQRAYREAHREEMNAKQRAYRAAHKDKINAQKKDWAAAKRALRKAEQAQQNG